MNALNLAHIARAGARLRFHTETADFSKYGGLYQSAFSAKDGLLYVTSSVGHTPVSNSDLLAVDPTSLDVEIDRKPPFIDGSEKSGRFAVYGVSVDEAAGLVWTANTHQATAAFYHHKSLKLGHQYEFAERGSQTRDVYANPNSHLAYVGYPRNDIIDVYSPDKTDGPVKVLNMTKSLGTKFSGIMSFVADVETNTLYTVSSENKLAAAIDMNTHNVKSWSLGDNVEGASGVAWDSKRSVLYVANQQSNNAVVLHPESGKIVTEIALPGNPLNAQYDPVYDLVYVTCRKGGAVAVIDANNHEVLELLPVGVPNHVSVSPEGVAYVTDRSEDSLLYKFTPRPDILISQ